MEKEEIILKRDELRKQLEEKNKNAKVGKITYYKDFQVLTDDKQYMPYLEDKVFIVSRKIEKDGLELEYYEIYDEYYQLIGRTDQSGAIDFDDEYVEGLKGKTKEFYEKLGIEKRTMYLNKDGEFVVNDKPQNELSDEERKENNIKTNEYAKTKVDDSEKNDKQNIEKDKTEDTQKTAIIEQDLGLNKDDISYCVEIKDDRFFDNVPESKKFSRTAMLIYSSKLGQFMIVGVNKDGSFQPYDSINPAKPSYETGINLDDDGQEIGRTPIAAMLNLKGINEYGYCVNFKNGEFEFQQVRRADTGDYLMSDIRTGLQRRADGAVEEIMSKTKNKETWDEVERFEQAGEKNVSIEEITGEEEQSEEEKDDGEKVPWPEDRER